MAQRNGIGTFPRQVMNRFPLPPLAEEGGLNDTPLRENFTERVLAYCCWPEMLDAESTPDSVIPVPAARVGKFDTAHKPTRET